MAKASRTCFNRRFTIVEQAYAQAPAGGKAPSDGATRLARVPGRLFARGATHAARHPAPRPDAAAVEYTHRLITPTDVSSVRADWRVTDDRTGAAFTVVCAPRDEGGDGSTWTLYLIAES